MKKIYLIFLILTTAFGFLPGSSINVPAEFMPIQTDSRVSHNPHDSLLFDGENSSIGNFLYNDSCVIAIWGGDVKGKVEGYVENISIETICGVIDTVREYKWQQVPDKGLTFLRPGDSIVTGPGSRVRVLIISIYDLPFGQEDADRESVSMGPKTVIVPKCGAYSQVLLKRGKLWTQDKKEKAEKKFIETFRSVIKPEGTEYSVEVSDKEDIVKVYEGSVTINMKNISDNTSENYEKEVTRLSGELMAGKITPEEFERKINELAKDVTPMKTVEAGHQCSVSEKMGEIVPLVQDDKWW